MKMATIKGQNALNQVIAQYMSIHWQKAIIIKS
jgi:hypothetical protein